MGEAIVWPDLTAYGVTLGLVTLDGGKKQLVYADESGRYKHIARNMGFSKTRWDGLWVRSDTRVEASAFRTAFPKVVVTRKSEQEISDQAYEKIRTLVEISRQTLLPGFEAVGPLLGDTKKTRSSPKVKRLIKSEDPNLETLDGNEIDLSPLISESRLMGSNLAGEEVYESVDGQRFVRFEVELSTGTAERIVRETARVGADDVTLARFLRGDSEQSLQLCAKAFVSLMEQGRTARVDELQRFFRAVTGREYTPTDPDLSVVFSAIDARRVEVASVRHGSDGQLLSDHEVFKKAMRLHESAQYYSIVNTGRMTPLPIGVVIQNIASSMPAGSTIRIDNALHGEFGQFDGEASPFKLAEQDQSQDILLGAYPGQLLDHSVLAYGTSVSREDHAKVLTSLEKMPDVGLGVFVIEGDAAPGRIGPSSRRFLDALATIREIEGMVDVDGSLMGIPGALPSRIIVVGNKKEIPGHGGLPTALPYVTEYESLWAWGAQITAAIAKPGSVPHSERGGVANEGGLENAFQAPYIPASSLTDPSLMIPRNLASPVRRAMLNVLNDHPQIDDWLQKELGFDSKEEMAKCISSEQADAVALGLQRMVGGNLGFMLADQTGIGKGRVLTMLARAARIRGETVVFVTEGEHLFTDFWRDIEDTNSEAFFKNIMVINDDSEIISTKTGDVVAKSAPRDFVEKTMRSMKLPENVDIIFATYSQFNRDPIKAIKNAGLIDASGLNTAELSASAKNAIDYARRRRSAMGLKEAKEILVEAVDIVTDKTLIDKMPLSAVKSLWIGTALKGAFLTMDEAHNASGETSQTNLNFEKAVMAAKTVCYSSATFARRERNMRIYKRLFPATVDVNGLHETLKKGGEPLQESLSAMLAEDGALIRREHDLSMLKFEPVIDEVRRPRNEIYADQLAEILSAMTVLTRESRQISDAVSEDIKNALQELAGKEANVEAVGIIKRSPIGNSLYMIMRGFLTVMTAELAVEEAVKDLKEGRKPVLVIEHTMEAELNRRVDDFIERGVAVKTDEGYVMPAPGFRAILKDRLDSMLKVSVDGKDLGLRDKPEFARIIAMIDGLIEKFPDFPTSPIDVLREGIERAGYNTAELSGRSNRVRYRQDGTILVQPVSKKDKKKARDEFNNGGAHALILTRAGNSGISVHDSYRFINRGQRVLIEVEVPEDVIVRTQFFGRVNRNGQMSYPIIKTLSTGLPAQNRVLALQNNKLRRMSANITANRDNAAITKEVADIINTVGNEVAFRFLELDPELAKKLDINIEQKVNEDDGLPMTFSGEKYISELMNRMVLLPVAQQYQVIDAVNEEFNALVEELDVKGENPLKPKFYDVNATVEHSEPLDQSEALNLAGDLAFASSFDRPVMVSTIKYKQKYTPIAAKEIVELLKYHSETAEAKFESAFENDPGYQAWRIQNPDDHHTDYVVHYLLKNREDILSRYLSKENPSIEAALAAGDNNLVIQTDRKISFLASSLSALRPGSTFTSGLDASMYGLKEDNNMALSVTVPSPGDLHHVSRYHVRYLQKGRGYYDFITLSSLMNGGKFNVLESQLSAQTLKDYESVVVSSYDIVRPIMNGNLFRAAELSMQAHEGVQAYFSDDKGLINKAIVLPSDFSFKELHKLPLRIKDPESIVDYFNTVDDGELFSSSSTSESKADANKGFKLKKLKDEIIVSIPGNSQWINWIRSQHKVMAVTGPFGGSRSALYAAVPMSRVDALVKALYESDINLYASPRSVWTISTLPAGTNTRYMRPSELARYTQSGNARDWFAQRLGLVQDVQPNAKAQMPHDPFAKIDRTSPGLRAA